METNKIYNMDCINGMKHIDDNSIDSIVTDPPYELGFMGKSWDNSGIAYNLEMWKEAYRILKPGGFLLSFGGTRTYHRMACAIEDAGFEIRDQIQWIYGSGFPKSLNIGKTIDKLKGNEREVIGTGKTGIGEERSLYRNSLIGEYEITKGNSEWEGWGTALKPANEPIVVARKPLSEKTVAENVLKWGTGGINIDECRVGYLNNNDFEKYKGSCDSLNSKTFNNSWKNSSNKDFSNAPNLQGRFPANVILDEEAGKMLDEQSGISKSSNTKRQRNTLGSFGMPNDNTPEYSDKGGASRFFYCAKAGKSERNQGLDGFEEQYSPNNLSGGTENRLDGKKVDKSKNIHPTVKPLKLMQYLVRLVTPKNGIVLDPFMGSGTTGMAAKSQGFKYIGFDMTKEYCKIAEARIESVEIQKKLLEE